ncbi:MAG: glycosyltransferase [Gemmatimonadaceae bacterium]
MRALLSTIGSRGDVQPLVALAWKLRELGHVAHLCVPPDFCEWIEQLGFSVTPIGPQLRGTAKPGTQAARPTAEQLRQMTEGTVATQFETIARAAHDCDIIVGATALQIAAPSIAESMGIPYVFVSYCPAVLSSVHHAPPVYSLRGDEPAVSPSEYPRLWAQNAQRFNDSFGTALNAHRANLGLAPVHDVGGHIFTDRPWLAADATLAPWPDASDQKVFQTGAWILPDDRPLEREIESFLDAGEAPVYFGFGSIRAPENLNSAMITSARAHGRRVIVSRGWADLSLLDHASDCLLIGEVNQQALFKRVAAVAHHGGAGTTTAAARAGAPQLIIPQHYDQYYWATRVDKLGIGCAHGPDAPTADSLTHAFAGLLQSDVAARAMSLASHVSSNGAQLAAQTLFVRA